jgi:hypothetical protein
LLTKLLPIGALILAAVAAAWPYLAFPSILVVLLAAIVVPRWRLAVGIAGGLLSTVALVRFAVEIAVPNIIGSGQRAGEEKAVSRLREIRWAEDKQHVDGGEWVGLPALTGKVMISAPMTQAGDAFLSEGYFYVVHPRKDGFIALAWPEHVGQSGFRAFAIDEKDHICATKDRATNMPGDWAIPESGQCADGWVDWRKQRGRGRR